MSLVFPLLAQILLTLVLIGRLGMMRVAVHRARQVRFGDVALSDEAYPEDIRRAGNNFRNQFETPVIFYVLCGVAIYVGATGLVMTLLAWLFVASRVAHSLIHLTYNRVPQRFLPFLGGVIVLALMWIFIVARLVVA